MLRAGRRFAPAGTLWDWALWSWPTACPSEQLDAGRPEGFAEVHFWIDTRDTRDVSRATRFCHHFVVKLTRRGLRGKLTAEVFQRPIARAVADAPIYRGELILGPARE